MSRNIKLPRTFSCMISRTKCWVRIAGEGVRDGQDVSSHVFFVSPMGLEAWSLGRKGVRMKPEREDLGMICPVPLKALV
jgi:hypothetical protein